MEFKKGDLIKINGLIYQISHIDRNGDIYFFFGSDLILLTDKIKSLIEIHYKLDNNENYIKVVDALC